MIMKDVPARYCDTAESLKYYMKREEWTVDEVREWIERAKKRYIPPLDTSDKSIYSTTHTA